MKFRLSVDDIEFIPGAVESTESRWKIEKMRPFGFRENRMRWPGDDGYEIEADKRAKGFDKKGRNHIKTDEWWTREVLITDKIGVIDFPDLEAFVKFIRESRYSWSVRADELGPSLEQSEY